MGKTAKRRVQRGGADPVLSRNTDSPVDQLFSCMMRHGTWDKAVLVR
jgi:hypothetical protein